ncbi:MAG TPA: urease accessory protein UreF [Nitrospirales bacterium]|nr:urease accessory protein UreF [Nitrospirales bacterium]
MSDSHDLKTYRLFQLTDSLFPTGAFACSYGLEAYAQEGVVHDAATLSSFIATSVRIALGRGDGLFASMSYVSSKNQAWNQIIAFDGMINAMKIAKEAREASVKIGRRLTSTMASVYPRHGTRKLASMVKTRSICGHHAVMFGGLCAHLDISQKDCVQVFLYTWLSCVVSAAIRLRIIGPIEGQQQIASQMPLLTEVSDTILNRRAEDLAPSSPGLDIRMMTHEKSYSRLFIT